MGLSIGMPVSSFCAEDDPKEADSAEPKEKKPQKPIAFIDISNSKEGSYPGGSTPKKGKWYVDASAKKLKVAVEPLVEAWFEFGPEIREKGATIQAMGRAPSEARVKSRMGVGLYGHNGFQLRLLFAKNELEIVRRGEILKSVPYRLKVAQLYRMELSVIEDEDNWLISGRVWEEDAIRPAEPSITDRALGDELLFPLAGRPVLVATPFSGVPVEFAAAKVFDGEYEVVPDDEPAESDEKSMK